MTAHCLSGADVGTIQSFLKLLSRLTNLPILVGESGAPQPLVVDELAAAKRGWLAWLEARPELIASLRGNWVALFENRVVARGDDELTVLRGASERLGVPPAALLAVPIGVPGSDYRWETIRGDLALQ